MVSLLLSYRAELSSSMGRTRACRWAEFWFRSSSDKDTKEHGNFWDLCLWGRMSDQRSNVQKHNVQGVWFHPNTRTFIYMNDIYLRSLSHLHTRLQMFFTHAFPLQLPYIASSCCAWPGLPPGLFLSMLSSAPVFNGRLEGFFSQPQTDWLLLTQDLDMVLSVLLPHASPWQSDFPQSNKDTPLPELLCRATRAKLLKQKCP